MNRPEHFDVAILGSGLAGTALCRHLLMNSTGKRILLLDNKVDVPGNKQKVGESLVQVGGYYFSRVLDLEEYLLREHYLKYNLRFYWKTPGKENRNFEDYGQSFIRAASNVCSYQLDRNKIESQLLSLNLQSGNVTFYQFAAALKVDLSSDGPHQISFNHHGERVELQAEWVIDTTGRGQFLKRKNDLGRQSPIQNGASWCWVEGLVNIEKLTDMSLQQIRTKPQRRQQGHFPSWLATNHFCGEGFWFWVIPLQGLTSLGCVYDRRLFDGEKVSTPEKMIEWACEEFPLFRRDLPYRKVTDSARFLNYAYDCVQTLSPHKWAMSGMAGRFTDPLYSPGSDLISYYNTMIVDLILNTSDQELEQKCELYSQLMQVVYEAYVPSYAVTYNALGNQEVFTLKYSWELAIYFSFYVFSFINDLFTNPIYIHTFFRKFAQLGPINRNLQEFLSHYYWWRKDKEPVQDTILNDFTALSPLAKAEKCFYKVGVDASEAEEILSDSLDNMKEFARFILAYVSSVLLQEPQAIYNRSFVESIKLRSYEFDPAAIRRRYRTHQGCQDHYEWKLDAAAMEVFRIPLQIGAEAAKKRRVAQAASVASAEQAL